MARYTRPEDASVGAGEEYEYLFVVEDIEEVTNENGQVYYAFLSSELASGLVGSLIYDMFQYGFPEDGETGVQLSRVSIEENFIVANSGEGAKCKVEIIGRSELIRARGYKLPEDDLVIENLYAESTDSPDGDDFDYDGPIDAGDPVEETTQQETFAG